MAQRFSLCFRITVCLVTWGGTRGLQAAAPATPSPRPPRISSSGDVGQEQKRTALTATSRARVSLQNDNAEIRTLGDSLELSKDRMTSPITMSDDGSTIIGYGTLGGKDQYIIWNADTGALSPLSPQKQPQPLAVSGDGQVYIGMWTGAGGPPFYAAKNELRVLAPGPKEGRLILSALSSDGKVAAGVRYIDGNETEIQLWRPDLGFETVAKATKATVNDISADGTLVVGSIYDAGKERAAYWTKSSGLRTIEPTSEKTEMTAQAVSADGRTIVGRYHANMRDSPFCWTEKGGLQLLPQLEGTDYSVYVAHDVSGDGRVIVGGAGLLDAAVIWMLPSRRARDIRRILVEDHGLAEAVKDLELTEAIKVSSDGRQILCRARRALPGKKSFLTQTVLVSLPTF